MSMKFGMATLACLTLACISACTNAQGQQKLNADAFEKALKEAGSNAVLVDVRTPEEFETGYLEGATNIDYRSEDFDSLISKLDKEKTIFLYCASGGRSEEAAQLLARKGYSSVEELQGGIIAWRSANKSLKNAKPLPRDFSPAEFDEAISGDKLVMVDFYTTWCGPCKLMAPDVERIKNEMSEKVIVLKVDAEAHRDISGRFNITGYPTIMFFKNNTVLRTLMGAQTFNELAMTVNMLN
jgi:thioredoxin 1